MALKPMYGKGILNALFHTSGSAGKTAEQEKEELKAKDVPISDSEGRDESWGGVPPQMYFLAFKSDGYLENGTATKRLDDMRREVLKTTWWSVENYSEVLEYEIPDSEDTATKLFTGWRIKRETTQNLWYPEAAFLALFTKMPDETGAGYEEPMYDSEGNPTTYIRVDLHKAIISGGKCISRADKDPNGGSYIVNTEMFAFPEVYGPLWGTIVGFGVMESDTPGGGDVPTHWGRVTTPLVTKEGRIPLFREGGFRSTLR